MRDARRLCHSGAFQFNLLGADMLEQSDTFTEEHRHKVNQYFVQQSRSYALLSDIRAAQHIDIFSPAAAFACVMALSIPSVTKVNGVAPLGTSSGI
jgi:hypothetical protein